MDKSEKYTDYERRFIDDSRRIISDSRNEAVRSVDFCRVKMYWLLGQRIFVEEQRGKDRADYGTYLTTSLAAILEPEFGSGFSKRQLEMSRQFFRTYPIANTLRSQLNWSQYRTLIQISDKDKREYYELEAVNNGWTARELDRQKNSLLYERLLKSSDKESVLAVARKERLPESPLEIVKDPMYLEFLGLQQNAGIMMTFFSSMPVKDMRRGNGRMSFWMSTSHGLLRHISSGRKKNVFPAAYH